MSSEESFVSDVLFSDVSAVRPKFLNAASNISEGRELLYEARTSAESLAEKADNRDDAERVKALCEDISYNSDRDDEVEARNS